MSDAPDWFLDLVILYGPILGTDNKAGPSVLAQWHTLFIMCGYRRDEIEEGFSTLAKDPNRPTYRQEMLQYIQRAIHRKRHEDTQSQRVEEETVAQCKICDGTGVVVVPRLSDVNAEGWQLVVSAAGGRPRRWTATVACSCPKGARTAEFTRSKDAQGKHRVARPIRTLSNYEMHNPRWREQLAEEKERQQVQQEIEGKTAGLDHEQGRVRKIGIIPKEWL